MRGRFSSPVERPLVQERWDTARTEAFSDGVFAIAITLLVLEIDVPESDFDNLARGIAHQWPSYLGYVTSFVTIGGLWLAHHGVFRRLAFVNSAIMRLNLVLLMVVSFLPFPTKLMAEAIRDDSAERAAVIFYGATLLAISITFSALWSVAVRDRELLKEGIAEQEVADVVRAASPSLGFYASFTVLAIFVPKVAAVGYLVVAVLAVLRARGDPHESRSTAHA